MDRGWNRSNEKIYRQPSSGGHYQPHQSHQSHQSHSQHYYRKKNDFTGPEFYSKTTKPNVQSLKKDSLQVSLIEDELKDIHFSWIKNSII